MFIHGTAEVSPRATIGAGTRIWNHAQIRENAKIGINCIISKDVYIDAGVQVGDSCKIQNGVSIYSGVSVADRVFIGPYATFTNDRFPRAFNDHWECISTNIEEGASIGANATIVCGHHLGKYCMVAAGSVVTKDVAPYSLVAGNPARLIGYVCECGLRLAETLRCSCGKTYKLEGHGLSLG